MASWVSEVAPRVGLTSFSIATVTIERMALQVVNTSGEPKLPRMTMARCLGIYWRTIPKQFGLMVFNYTCMRELKLALDSVQPSRALSTMLACGIMGVPCASIQYNWTIRDTYTAFGHRPPEQPSLAGFYRLKVAPGLCWSFLRASCCTGSAMHLGPPVAAMMEARATEVLGWEPPGWVTRTLAGLLTGGLCSMATQWTHNIALVAGRMAALGNAAQAPYYTTISMRTAWREFGVSIFYLNFMERMVINAVAVAVMNFCDIFGNPELSPWRR